MDKFIEVYDDLKGEMVKLKISEELTEWVRSGKRDNDPVIVAKREKTAEWLARLDEESLKIIRRQR
ncbi:MAG TPA: hypothetical protein VL547_02565 [Dinghuibacter sp.]|jgi:hypothetical protein|uniref:hypothetical protein n=1 Tax=Dinghuibacter sp. TaxID=2024697 RepID=UPI002C4620B7|nr:hypothetical protein [Dinghuibacter sp.]HTJ10876.1 hypothetical protein [Dinghuibacter sp.]